MLFLLPLREDFSKTALLGTSVALFTSIIRNTVSDSPATNHQNDEHDKKIPFVVCWRRGGEGEGGKGIARLQAPFATIAMAAQGCAAHPPKLVSAIHMKRLKHDKVRLLPMEDCRMGSPTPCSLPLLVGSSDCYLFRTFEHHLHNKKFNDHSELEAEFPHLCD